jgi:hypothetical protein
LKEPLEGITRACGCLCSLIKDRLKREGDDEMGGGSTDAEKASVCRSDIAINKQ